MPEHRLDSVAQNRTLGQPAVKLTPVYGTTGPAPGQINTDEMAQKAAEIDQWLKEQKAPSTLTELQPKKKNVTGLGSEIRQLNVLEKEGY